MKKGGKSAYIREVLRDYPKICEKLPEKRSKNEQRRFETVNALLETVDQMPDARSKRKIIEIVYFKKSHTLQGAALQISVGERTAQRWNAQIMDAVEKIMDLP